MYDRRGDSIASIIDADRRPQSRKYTYTSSVGPWHTATLRVTRRPEVGGSRGRRKLYRGRHCGTSRDPSATKVEVPALY